MDLTRRTCRTGAYDYSVDIVVLEILRTQSITTHLCLDVIALIPAPSESQLHTIIIFPALSPRSLCLPLLYPPIWRETALPLVEHNRCCTLAASSFNPLLYQQADVYSKKRWRRVQYLLNVFWSRWKNEYLQTLQMWSKWNENTREVSKGDIVIIKDDNQPKTVGYQL